MSDFLRKEKRSTLMSQVRGKNTGLERYVRNRVWRFGFRYRLHIREMPGTPDLVLRRFRTVVFVQGCFWHRHTCAKGRTYPATNTEFWKRKLDRNAARDILNQAKLSERGWIVRVVWECTLRDDTDALIDHLCRLKSLSRSAM